MPPITQKSAFLTQMGDRLRKAHAQHAASPVEYSSFGDLPEIPNGIARLVECKFDTVKPGKENAGKYFFYAAGVVLTPKQVTDKDGQPMRVEGLRTSITEMLFDTPGKTRETTEDHLGWVYNELKKLGVDMASVQDDQLEQVAESLKAAQPYFRFSTRAGKVQTEGPYAGKPPMIFHSWNGACDYHEADDGGGVDDNTHQAEPARPAPQPAAAARPSTNGTTAKAAAQPAQKAPAAASKVAPAAVPPPPPPDPEYSDAEDLGSLVERANQPDGDDSQAARDRLLDLAEAAGGKALREKAEDAPSWAVVVHMLGRSGGATPASQAEATGPAEDGAPAVGDIYLFSPPPSKPGGRRGKAVEVEVKAVIPSLKTCTVERLDDKSKHNNVNWTDLIAQ